MSDFFSMLRVVVDLLEYAFIGLRDEDTQRDANQRQEEAVASESWPPSHIRKGHVRSVHRSSHWYDVLVVVVPVRPQSLLFHRRNLRLF